MTIKYPNYIEDKPIGKDQFEGRSHERIANNISNHIKSNTGLKILGIDGEWGSGKSNIIELINDRLKDTHHSFVYDCWGHQEDYHRRAFLEELTEDLVKNEMLNEETEYLNYKGELETITWIKRIKHLLARKRETEHKSVPKISVGIIVIGLILILSPLLTYISDTIIDEKADWWEKLILPISPILIAAILYLCLSWRKRKWINLSELFYLYKGTELENTTYEILADSEPTVKEFKNWIESISDGLKKELIIVFDNMDRLPPDKVKGIWSSIHTFFAESTYKNIHVLIPFDRIHLQQAFKEQDDTNEFINKTFSITYRVSPPVLTDWKDFFTQKFEEAFGENEEDFATVLSIFDRLKPKFTPRDIIVFINELVTYRSIWNDEIPLRYIAVFVLKKDEILLDNPQKVILENKFLDNAQNLFIEDKELQNYIAALAFNVPVTKASQVTLVRELELILRNDSELTVNEFTNHNHFIEILEVVIFNSELILNKAIPVLASLDTQKIKGKRIKSRIIKIWDELSAQQCNIQLKTLEFTDNYKLLLQHSSFGSQKKIISYLTEGYPNTENLSGSNYYNSLSKLESVIKEQSIKHNLDSHIKTHAVDPDIFIDYLSVANKNYEKFKVKTDKNELDNYLSEKIPEQIDTIPDNIDYSILLEEYEFDKTKVKIEGLIDSGTLTAANFSKILQVYKSISESPVDKRIIATNLHQLLQSVDESKEGYYDLLAMRLSYAIEYNQQIQPHRLQDNTANILQSFPEDLVKEVANRIENYKSYGPLLISATTWNQPLHNAVCKYLTLNDTGAHKLNIEGVLPVFDKICKTINVEEEELLKKLNGWSNYAIEKVNSNNIKDLIYGFEFLNFTSISSLKLSEHINKTTKEYINEIEEQVALDQWGDVSSFGYNSLYILMNKGKIKTLPRNIFNTIKKVLMKISEAGLNVPEADSIWEYFIEKSLKKDIAPTIRSIRDYFINHNNITAVQFIFFKEFFKQFGNLNDNPGNVVRTILGRVISDNQCFNCILENQEFYIPIINSANEDAADLKDSILERILGEEVSSNVRDFAEKIGVRKDTEE